MYQTGGVAGLGASSQSELLLVETISGPAIFKDDIIYIPVKIVDSGLYFIFSFHFIFLLLSFSFYFSIFRTTWVRVHQSCCHISHKLMA